MKIVYVVNCETSFAEERDGHFGEMWVDSVYESREDAVNYVNEEFTENTGPDESGCLYEFILDRPIILEESGEHTAETGDKMRIFISRADFIPTKGS